MRGQVASNRKGKAVTGKRPWESFWLWTLKMIVDGILVIYALCLMSNNPPIIRPINPLIGCIALCLVGVSLNVLVLAQKTYDMYLTKYIMLWDVSKVLMGVGAVIWISLRYYSYQFEPNSTTKEDDRMKVLNMLIYSVVMLILSFLNLITIFVNCSKNAPNQNQPQQQQGQPQQQDILPATSMSNEKREEARAGGVRKRATETEV